MARWKAKYPFSLKMTCIGWLKHAHFVATLDDHLGGLGEVLVIFGDNGSILHPMGSHEAPITSSWWCLRGLQVLFWAYSHCVGQNWLAYSEHCVSVQTLVSLHFFPFT